jgi:hypothetical protein
MEAKKSFWKMDRWSWWLVVIIFSASSVFGYDYYLTKTGKKVNEKQLANSNADVIENKEDAIITVTPIQYYTDYQDNQIAADDKYKGNKINISGKIQGIGRDKQDGVFITLSAGDFIEDVRCFLQNEDAVKELKKGNKISLSGIGKGRDIFGPELEECVIN